MLRAGGCLVNAIPYCQGIFRFLILRNPFMSQPDNPNLFMHRSLYLLANPMGTKVINVSGLFRFPFCNFKMTTKVLLFSNPRLTPTSVYAIYL